MLKAIHITEDRHITLDPGLIVSIDQEYHGGGGVTASIHMRNGQLITVDGLEDFDHIYRLIGGFTDPRDIPTEAPELQYVPATPVDYPFNKLETIELPMSFSERVAYVLSLNCTGCTVCDFLNKAARKLDTGATVPSNVIQFPVRKNYTPGDHVSLIAPTKSGKDMWMREMLSRLSQDFLVIYPNDPS